MHIHVYMYMQIDEHKEQLCELQETEGAEAYKEVCIKHEPYSMRGRRRVGVKELGKGKEGGCL